MNLLRLLRRPLLVSVALVLPLISSCTTPDAAPGVNAREEKFILKNLVTSSPKDAGQASYSDAAVRKLIRRSTDPTLDGERGEWHTTAMALAVANVGDERFAALLAGEPLKTQRAAGIWLRRLWTLEPPLKYPKTRALVEAAAKKPPGN